MPDEQNISPAVPPATDAQPAATTTGSGADANKFYDTGTATPPPAAATPPSDTNKGTDGKADPVPPVYDLKLPDGSFLDPTTKDEVASFAKEKGLSGEIAQAVLERESKAIASYVDREKQKFQEMQKQWVQAAQTDKEIGGENFGKNRELAHRVLQKFASDDLKKILSDPQLGYGNHTELLRMFVRIGKSMSEPELIIPGTGPVGKKSMEDVFYPAAKS